ncbi:MAG: copper chaperone PCu(A)C [Thermodesulfobacteriota bacterium]
MLAKLTVEFLKTWIWWVLAPAVLFPYSSLGAPSIEIKGAWVREVPPVSSVAAGYMVIANTGDEDDRLVGVSSSVSKFAELHTSEVDDKGVAKMKKLDALSVPAGASVELKPYGTHIMLIELTKPVREGDEVLFELVFEKTGTVTARAKVSIDAPGETGHKHIHERPHNH